MNNLMDQNYHGFYIVIACFVLDANISLFRKTTGGDIHKSYQAKNHKMTVDRFESRVSIYKQIASVSVQSS